MWCQICVYMFMLKREFEKRQHHNTVMFLVMHCNVLCEMSIFAFQFLDLFSGVLQQQQVNLGS